MTGLPLSGGPFHDDPAPRTMAWIYLPHAGLQYTYERAYP